MAVSLQTTAAIVANRTKLLLGSGRKKHPDA